MAIVPIAVRADLAVSLEPLQHFNQQGHAVPLLMTITNTGAVTENVPEYLVPYYDFDLQVRNENGMVMPRSSPLFDLSYLRSVQERPLAPGGTCSQKITDMNGMYRISEVGTYTVSPVYYPERDPARAVIGSAIDVPVGNIAGDRSFLVFSDTAYVQKTFCFTSVYPNANSYLRDFSNNYFILGISSDWLQAGAGYSDGTYAGMKWQVWKESSWVPAFAAQYFGWYGGREVITIDRDVRGYWTEERSSTYVLSKRLPLRAHMHVGTKRHEVMNKLESESAIQAVYPITMLALDQSYSWGTLIAEHDYDSQQEIVSQAFIYRGLPSWEPEIGLGLVHYDQIGAQEVTMLFFSLYFKMDNFLLGYNF